MNYSLCTWTHPSLQRKTQWVEDFSNLSEKLEDMVGAMKFLHGVGLAANQIGFTERMFVYLQGEDVRYIVNPVIIERITPKQKDYEGCLSFPGIDLVVPRYSAVTVTYQNPQGVQLRGTFSGYEARIFQHEIDHLDGIRILDRVPSRIKKEALKNLRSG